MPEQPKRLGDFSSYEGVAVTILGLGTFGGGTAAARFLAEHRAAVTVTDLRPADQLAEALASLHDLRLHAVYCGEHPDRAFQDAQLLIVNPAVKPDNQIVERCRERGCVISSEIALFLHHNRAHVAAVTGSNGKSTTATLIQTLLQAGTSDGRRVWLGGNIGRSLLPEVDRIQPDDVVVLELSSFQLHQLRNAAFAPRVAVVTNFAANHLDWHGSVQHYRSSKQVLLQRQRRDDIAILPDHFSADPLAADPNDRAAVWRPRGVHLRFGCRDQGEDGGFLEDGLLVLRRGAVEDAVRLNVPAKLPGEHNRQNIAAAACAAWVLGADASRFAAAVSAFRPLEHRLQLVASGKGIQFFNDSVATTPESAIAALTSFSQPCVLLAGGANKGADLSELAAAIAKHAAAVVLMGGTATTLAALLEQQASDGRDIRVRIASDFQDAFRAAVELAGQTGIVLLSPGCASYGWFRDFRERGDQFIELARKWSNS